MTEAASPGTLDPAAPIEEETVKGYKAEHYYPVTIGEVLGERYKVIGKLGYGSASTVWLCRDSHGDGEYVALKVYINSSKVLREVAIYEHINGLDSQHYGRARVRKLLDSFAIAGPHGRHPCLVHEALGMNLEELRDLVPGGVFDSGLIRHCLRDILRGIDFLHKEAQIVHTGLNDTFKCSQRGTDIFLADIQPKNILLGILDNSAFARFERDEKDASFPRKQLPNRTVYLSRPMPLTKGEPSLCDLSEARFGNGLNTDLVMPSVYRAPEVVLGMQWSYPIDFWAFAMTVSLASCTDEHLGSLAFRTDVLTFATALGSLRASETLFARWRGRKVFRAASSRADGVDSRSTSSTLFGSIREVPKALGCRR